MTSQLARPSLYRLDPDGSVAGGVGPASPCLNGLEWSPDGSLAYYNDTATCTIAVFDYDTAAGLTNRRMFAELPDGGRPDGLTVDAEGGVWTAVSNGRRRLRYRADGVLEEKLAVPAREGDRLHLRRRAPRPVLHHHLAGEHRHPRDPLAGSLFRADVGVKGLPVRLFAG